MTDVDGLTHLGTDAAMAAGRRAGICAAVCGDPVLAASLAAAQRREELADTLQALGYVLRVSTPAPEGER